MRIYNVVQIVVCSYMAYGFIVHMYGKTPVFHTIHLFGITPLIPFINTFAVDTKYNAGIEWFVFVHYLSKFLDFFDTLFIILRKKDEQHSFLHVFHHATIGAVWGFLLHMGHGNGTSGYGAFINSIVHIVMYSHYLVSSYGIQNPFKKYITQFQIMQFFSCEAHAFLVVMGGIEKQVPVWLGWLQIGYHVTMITLFMDFYNKQQKQRGAAKKNKEKDLDAKKVE
jgi:hypothetical protein